MTGRQTRRRHRQQPGRDFYKFVNGVWQRRVNIPTFAGSYGVSEEIEDAVREDILNSVSRLGKSDKDHPIALLARSVMNHQVQDNNIRDVRHMLASFNCLRDNEDVARAIGQLNRLQVRAPITFVVNADTYNSNVCRVHIYEPTLGLPSKHFYQGGANGARNRTILQYAAMLRRVGELLETDSLESVISIETAVIPALSEGDSLRDPAESHIPLSIRDLETRYKHVPWRVMLLAWGLPTDMIRDSTYVGTNERYLAHFDSMFKVFEMDAWRVWIRAGVVLTYLEFLPPPFDDIHYGLFGRALRGSVQKLPQRMLMLRVLQTFATQQLSKLFVSDHVEPRVKEVATALVRRLKTATMRRIQRVGWLSDTTKRIAADKVKAMRIQVAYPSEWTNEFAGINVDPERLIQNINALNTRDTARMIGTLGKGCGETRPTWDDGAFEVNAYYYPDRNQLTIPAGMLRPPFFDLRRSTAWNYGGIGAAVGHEITHGFDADGKNYDLHGSYKDWWAAKDNEAYDRMTESLVTLYGAEEYAGGHVDGRLTLSENIADIGGVAIALDALHEELRERHVTAAEKRAAWRDFFTSYAVSWRNKDRPRKAKQALYLDVHAPAPLRVNMVVRQFAEFYEAFGIGAGSPGWIDEKDRIQLW